MMKYLVRCNECNSTGYFKRNESDGSTTWTEERKNGLKMTAEESIELLNVLACNGSYHDLDGAWSICPVYEKEELWKI